MLGHQFRLHDSLKGIKKLILKVLGPPESPGECRSINQTETQIMVQCRLGYSGGLPQHIHLEIYSSSGYILANMSGI